MKIIEALKQVKDLQRKAEDLTQKIGQHCADMDFETALYTDPRAQVEEWLQAVQDIFKEILRLRLAIQRTNLETEVTIELGGKAVSKSIAAWIHRRRDLATAEKRLWSMLGDRGLKEGSVRQSSGEVREVKIRRYFDPRKRDQQVEMFTAEPTTVDARLEIVNAITDLKE